ncbi:NCA2-domain-containing protein [Hysterangium stoloniferum]|nr:NCA2-domain-containing protein [Hysterangium stoloniferum]
MSTLAVHQTEQLLHDALLSPRRSLPSSPSAGIHPTTSDKTQRLHSLLASFKAPVNPSLVQETIDILKKDGLGIASVTGNNEDEMMLREAAVAAIAASIYGRILDTLLHQATEADTEANWWAETERSRQGLIWYMIETLPMRLTRVFKTILRALRARDLAIRPQAFTPYSLRKLFPSTSSRPSRLAVSFFPHLSRQPSMFSRSPFELTRQECRVRRQALEKIRDDRAERLGILAASRPNTLHNTSDLTTFVATLDRIMEDSSSTETPGHENALIATLSVINDTGIAQASHMYELGISYLRKPSRLTRMWPRLLVIPPATIVIFRLIYGSERTLSDHAVQIAETAAGFWRNYLVQPVRDILDTVRTGGEEGARIVSPEGLKADMESLERMALALSKEKYNFTSAELENLSMHIRRGDLTPVLKVYEEDLKTPLKSALAGSLIRSLLIQIQKMKVDVDVALSGIDKLLKSQELTFAFVGVAPALAVVYTLFGWTKHIWLSGHGRGKYGGKGRRQSVWLCMRRIERLLVLSSTRSPSTASTPSNTGTSLTALDQGLILVSVAQLRSYAERYIPARSRLREEFLADVSDLEDTNLGRTEKMDVVHRMWRSWGQVLGWTSIVEK